VKLTRYQKEWKKSRKSFCKKAAKSICKIWN
jgi:hypothetical protein